jgi:predicted TIM-barrel fold metal-dependent hydrolase
LAGYGLHASSNSFATEPAKPESDAVPIIDTHQHLWDLSQFQLSWLKNDGSSVLGKSYVTSDYLEATKNVNVVQTVYMEVDVIPEQHNAEADYVLKLCEAQDNPMTGAVISGRPGEAGFGKYMERFASNAFIKGVRQVLHGGTPAGYCLQKQFVESVKLLGEMNKSYDLCMRPNELMDGVKLIDQCPKTRFVLDHCGNGPIAPKDKNDFAMWLQGLQEMAKRPNVVCKISGIVASAPEAWKTSDLEPVVQASIEAFGEDRIMFAGDWPVCLLRSSYERWVNALKELVKNRSNTFQKKLFHDNALKFYGLPSKKAGN